MTKPIAFVTGYHDGYPVIQPVDGAAVLPTGMALYDHPAPDVQPVGKFAKFTDGIWREVTAGSAGVPLYEHQPAADVQPVAWSVFDKRTQKHWYTNESVNTAGDYAKEYSHREADGSPSMLVVPLYTHPAADVQELVEPVALEKVYETIVQWDEGGGKRSRRELAKQIIDLYTNTPAADVAELMAQEREACAKVVLDKLTTVVNQKLDAMIGEKK